MLEQQLFNGLVLGATYALVALGFTLIVGVLDLLNLALGEIFMAASFVGLVTMTEADLPLWLALLAAMAAGAALSIVVYVISFRAVRQEYFTAPILSTLGVGIILTAGVARLAGSGQREFPTGLPDTAYRLAGIRVLVPEIVILGVATVLGVGLYLLINRTKLGLAIRAIAESPATAGLLGVPVQRVILITFAIAGGLAGASGVLTGLSFNTVSPFEGFQATITGLTVIVLGGLGNVTGAVVAAVGIAVIETLSVVYLSATARELIVFLLLAAVLLVRPQGLFGTNTHREAK